MCDLVLNVSGGMSPQRDDFSAKVAAYAMPIGDLIVLSRCKSPGRIGSDRSTSAGPVSPI
jgi:hypothetical protein